MPLRDFSKVAHRVAVTGGPDEQSRLFWGPIVSVFPASRIAYSWWNNSLSVCVVISLAFYNSVVCFLLEQVPAGTAKRVVYGVVCFGQNALFCYLLFILLVSASDFCSRTGPCVGRRQIACNCINCNTFISHSNGHCVTCYCSFISAAFQP